MQFDIINVLCIVELFLVLIDIYKTLKTSFRLPFHKLTFDWLSINWILIGFPQTEFWLAFQENQYMDAMDTLGAMICQYNIEQEIALYGFGANWKNKKSVSHCFPLTKEVFVKGIKVQIFLYLSYHN